MRQSLLAALIVTLVACLVPAGGARAAWREAQTTNFVIYAGLLDAGMTWVESEPEGGETGETGEDGGEA